MTNDLLVIEQIPEKFDRSYFARDRENPDIKYDVNIARLSCTCRDLTERRLTFPHGDVRRVCAHLYDKLYQTKAERDFDPLVQLFIRYGMDGLSSGSHSASARSNWICHTRLCFDGLWDNPLWK